MDYLPMTLLFSLFLYGLLFESRLFSIFLYLLIPYTIIEVSYPSCGQTILRQNFTIDKTKAYLRKYNEGKTDLKINFSSILLRAIGEVLKNTNHKGRTDSYASVKVEKSDICSTVSVDRKYVVHHTTRGCGLKGILDISTKFRAQILE